MSQNSVLCLRPIEAGVARQKKGTEIVRTVTGAAWAMRWSCLFALALTFALGALGDRAGAQPPAMASPSGQPCQISEETVGQKTFMVSRMVVKARPEQIFRIITDYNNAVNVFPHLKKCQVIQDKGATKLVCHEIEPSGPFGTFEYVLEVKETAPRSLEWHQVRGDMPGVMAALKAKAEGPTTIAGRPVPQHHN